MQKETAILLLACPDCKGIVAEISQFIFTHKGNILHSDQHTDYKAHTFFMRIEWELKDFTIPKNTIGEKFSHIAKRFQMSWSLHFSPKKMKTAIFVSKFDHCLYDLLIRHSANELAMDIGLIISNHDTLQRVADFFGINFHHIPVGPDSKGAAEKRQMRLLEEHDTELIVLARYMQILSEKFVSKYNNQIINIHHSFLPAFVGAKPYHQAYDRGVKIIGATSHYVTNELDQGPIIEQDVVRISHRDSVHDLIQKGKNLEKLVLSRAVKLHLEHKVLVGGNKTVVFD